MGNKTKPVTIIRKSLSEVQMAEMDEFISLNKCQIQWFSTVHQTLFAMRTVSYGHAAQVASTLDYGRVCHVRIVDTNHTVIYSFH